MRELAVAPQFPPTTDHRPCREAKVRLARIAKPAQPARSIWLRQADLDGNPVTQGCQQPAMQR